MTDQIRLKINQGPALRCKVLPGFAGTVAGTSPIVVTAGGGVRTVSLDLTALSAALGLPTGFGAGVSTWLATPTSANLAAAMTDETGTGALVFGTAPIFTTNITVPLVIGGSAVGSTLTLQSTSGNGSSDAIVFQVGNNGATEALRVLTGGQILQGSAVVGGFVGNSPRLQLHSTSSFMLASVNKWSADTAAGGFGFSKSRGASVGTYTIVQSGDELGSIIWRGADGTQDRAAAQITAFVDGTPGASDMPGRIAFYTTLDGSASVTERMRIANTGNIKIAGTVSRATTEGTNHVDIFDGTAPVGTLANGISLYSTAGELRVMDAAGNATLLSPHDKQTNEWIYHSVDSRTGKGLRIDMERMMRAINDRFGWDFVHEFAVDD